MLECLQTLHSKLRTKGIEMKSSRLWIIALGGVIGLILGVMITSAIFQGDEGGEWSLQPYAAIAPMADRAIELIGYDFQRKLLFVKGQSQTIYKCAAELSHIPAANTCHAVASNAITSSGSSHGCASIKVPVKDPPGHAVARLKQIDCPNEYQFIQIDYAILDDGNLWRLVYNNWGVGQGLQIMLSIIGGMLGTVVGLVIGALIPIGSKNHPRSSA
jgi:hypothetical protein